MEFAQWFCAAMISSRVTFPSLAGLEKDPQWLAITPLLGTLASGRTGRGHTRHHQSRKRPYQDDQRRRHSWRHSRRRTGRAT